MTGAGTTDVLHSRTLGLRLNQWQQPIRGQDGGRDLVPGKQPRSGESVELILVNDSGLSVSCPEQVQLEVDERPRAIVKYGRRRDVDG